MQLNSTTRATAHLPKRFVVQKVVFEEREVRHADVDHRQEWICPSAPVLGDNNVTAPRLFLVETTSLDFPNNFLSQKVDVSASQLPSLPSTLALAVNAIP